VNNRPIKFRGWTGSEMLPPEDLTQSPDHRKWLGKIDVVLMQFTGVLIRKDFGNNYSNEVYEGDILERKYDRYYSLNGFELARGVVTYSPSNGFSLTSVFVKLKGSKAWRKNKPINSLHNFKIIGNIYETHELMEQIK